MAQQADAAPMLLAWSGGGADAGVRVGIHIHGALGQVAIKFRNVALFNRCWASCYSLILAVVEYFSLHTVLYVLLLTMVAFPGLLCIGVNMAQQMQEARSGCRAFSSVIAVVGRVVRVKRRSITSLG